MLKMSMQRRQESKNWQVQLCTCIWGCCALIAGPIWVPAVFVAAAFVAGCAVFIAGCVRRWLCSSLAAFIAGCTVFIAGSIHCWLYSSPAVLCLLATFVTGCVRC